MIDFDAAGAPAFALSCAIDVVVVASAVGWAVRRRRPLVGALACAVGVCALKGVALLALGLDPFGAIHVLWLDLVVVVPLTAALLLAAARGRLGRWAPVVAVAGLGAATIGVYAGIVEPARLQTERATVTLPAQRAGDEPLRVGVIADLQFEHVGPHERAAVARLMRERPDVILIAGDVHQGSARVRAREQSSIAELLAGLRAPGGVYAVLGDHDTRPELAPLLAGTRIRLLVDDVARARVRDRSLTIAGVALEYRGAAADALLARLQRAAGDDDVRIVLAHRPDVVRRLRRPARVDLTVAGHTHGGQVQLPLVGPLVTFSSVPRAVAAGGLHELDGQRIYVTRGVGVVRGQAPRVRLGAVPEVSVVTLR